MGGGAWWRSLPAPPALPCLSQPFPALPSPTAPCHGAGRALEDSRAPREGPGRSPRSPGTSSLSVVTPQRRASTSRIIPTARSTARSIPTAWSIPAGPQSPANPEHPCQPRALLQPQAQLQSREPLAALGVPGSISTVPNISGSILGNTPAAPGIPDSIPANCLDHPPACEQTLRTFRASWTWRQRGFGLPKVKLGGIWYFCLSMGFIDSFALFKSRAGSSCLCRSCCGSQ